ncbi:MAG TPA: mannose-1-phosphate guanylyltransferase/mannose-6-phosphate isomerase [Dongiaceae bacterium]|nr:mannose-1-phosphate guanylyltransferase/mannose-6-phosphate isomerase [Dongiaceae bacterium]
MIPVILAGGSGSRLWPQSRALYPKQFLALMGDHSLLQQTLLRLQGLDMQNPIIVCNEDHRFLVAEQLRQIGVKPAAILLEPFGRNTAPAIALAAIHALATLSDQPLLILPADHAFQQPDLFRTAAREAAHYAARDFLVTFGIQPTLPETGYGYINGGAAVTLENGSGNGRRIQRFVEKPDLATATRYLESGEYFWNSGMFVFKASTYMEELETHNKAIADACRAALAGAKHDLDFIRIDKDAFSECPDDSIDYAVMEKTANAIMVPLSAGWSDVGSWSALWALESKDASGNVVKGDVITRATSNSYLQSGHRLLATLGVDNLVVIDTPDAVLVADKNQIQDVKKIVDQLKQEGRSEYKIHREVYRPWGKYDSIDMGDRFQVKRITVNPGAKLSVQMHHHRAEHWIVVSGTARVTRGEEHYLVTENQSTYIPLGTVHALENPGKIPLEMIEVQSGAYMGEDDIVRFEDKYGRA